MRRALSVLLTAAVCAGADAQRFNIDFDEAPGDAASPPIAAFGGAMGQAGTWNAVPAASLGPVRLADLNGNATGVVYRRIGGEGAFTFDNPQTTGEEHFLLDDLIDVGDVGSVATLRFDGLLPGRYRVVTYAIAPDDETGLTSISIGGVSTAQVVGGAVPWSGFLLGVTHADHGATVGADGVLAVRAQAANGFGSVNGMQLRLLAPARLYVSAAAVPGGDGTSWARALTSLNDALDVANSNPSAVREIWVARGTYFARTGAAWGFEHRCAARVYGGFAGNETRMIDRLVSYNTTVLSGSAGGAGGGNASWVVRLDPTSASFADVRAGFDGFVITGGGTPGQQGGGVDQRGGVVQNCRIEGNVGSTGGGVWMRGDATLVACKVTRNSAALGGGVYVEGDVARIETCEISLNHAGERGGGVVVTGSSWIRGTLVCANTAARGGGVAGEGAGLAPVFINCTVTQNSAGLFGGVDLRETGNGVRGPALLNTIVWDNRDTDPASDARQENLEYSRWPGFIHGSRCLIEGFAGAAGFDHTWNADPQFEDPLGADGVRASGDERLVPISGSPAVDAGDSSAIGPDEFDLDYDGDTGEPTPQDVYGAERLFDDPGTADTGPPALATVDIGAAEFNTPPVCPADFNGDGGVDGADVESFFLMWEEGDASADVNFDGGVDGADVEVFFLAWEAGGC